MSIVYVRPQNAVFNIEFSSEESISSEELQAIVDCLKDRLKSLKTQGSTIQKMQENGVYLFSKVNTMHRVYQRFITANKAVVTVDSTNARILFLANNKVLSRVPLKYFQVINPHSI